MVNGNEAEPSTLPWGDYLLDDPTQQMATSFGLQPTSNGGKTWTAVRATESGPHWSSVVTNPAKAGHVSLRVQGTDSSGFTASVTVVNAYAVS